jgi:hypothetical protein
MTSEELRQAGIELARRSRAEQGLAPKVTDPGALQRTAQLVRALLMQRATGSAPSPGRSGSSERDAA